MRALIKRKSTRVRKKMNELRNSITKPMTVGTKTE